MTAPTVAEPPLLEGHELTRHYRVSQGAFKSNALVRALDGISFRVHARQTLAVVGESGCGKSTLARLIAMIEPPTGGILRLDGVDYAAMNKAQRQPARRAIQMIFQNPFGSLNPRKKIGTIIAEPLIINTKQTKAERDDRVHWMMTKVGLRPEYYDRYPHMFSGGQRQRVAIARALILQPKVVVCDEPVSALDVSIQAQVLNLLLELQDEFDLAYIFISHDLSVVRHIADQVMVMYLGRAVEHGSRDAIFSAHGHPYTRALLASTPHLDPAARRARIALKGELPSPLNPPTGCAFHTRCPYAIDICARQRPELTQSPDRTSVSCHRAEELAAEFA